jgi:branched-chain amino acid transport system permease protein
LEFLSLTIIGLCTASIFALAASGLVLTYTTTGVFNFAHGAIGMLGAFAYWQLHSDWGWPALPSIALVLLVLAPALGFAIERGIMRGLSDAPETTRMVVSISLLVALLGIGMWIWSPQEPHPTTLLFPGHKVRIFDVSISWHQGLAFLLAGAVALGLRLLLYRTRVGLDMRASVDSRPLAMLHGARPDSAAALAWAIGCSLAALAGILIAPLSGSLSHTTLTLLIVNAYAAAMIGRLRSMPMTFVGAIILGLGDSYAIGYIPSDNRYFSTFRFALPVLILFVVLLVLRQPGLRTHSAATTREEIPRPSWGAAAATATGVVLSAAVLAAILSEADALRTAKIFGIGLIALSLVPLVGFAGQVSLCQMSFAAIGALVMAHQGHGGNPIALLYAAVLCGAVGALIALPALRLSGIYLALSTAAFAVFLDRWLFGLDSFEVGPWRIKLFEIGTVPVTPLDLPGLGTSRRVQLVTVAVAFALLYLLVVAVRRSDFGQRLLAMKDSPAACATIGMDVTRTKLAVFALSAAMAGVGGALFAGTIGSVSAETFSLFESLPLLLLAVVGGIGTASGALFAGLILGGYPIAVGIWPFLASLNRVLPGTMGVALGRNPNGAVRDISTRYRVLLHAPVALGGLLVTVAIAAGLAVADVITGWGLTISLAVGLVTWPQLAELLVARRRPPTRDLEWAGIESALTADELVAVNRALALNEVAAP